MSKFWKIIILIVVFFAIMLLTSFFVPEVNAFAKKLAAVNDLPFWLVGLLAPLLYGLKKIKNFLLDLGGKSSTEKEIKDLNEEIKTEMTKLRKDVNNMDSWMRQNVRQELQHISKLEQRLRLLQADRQQIDQLLDKLENASPEEFLTEMTDEEIETEFQKRLVENGLIEGEPVELID